MTAIQQETPLILIDRNQNLPKEINPKKTRHLLKTKRGFC